MKKKLNNMEMEKIQGEWKIRMCEIGAIGGCAIVSGAMGCISGGAGFVFGLYCSVISKDACK